MRHAMTKYPHTKYFWFLEQNALIMNPFITVEGDIMDPNLLESVMIREQSIVPPDSVIKTFSHLRGANVDFVLTQDKEGLSQGSFILRRGDWAKFFLDTWFDPLYRSYNFQKADTHALVSFVLQFSKYFEMHKLTSDPGAHCSVASNNPLKTGPHPPTYHERLQ